MSVAERVMQAVMGRATYLQIEELRARAQQTAAEARSKASSML